MQLLNFNIKNQIIQRCGCGRIVVAKSRGHVYAAFELDKDWDGLDVTAIFENDRLPGLFPVSLGADPVEVPTTVLVPGGLRVSLEGISEDGTLRLTTKYMSTPIRILRS